MKKYFYFLSWLFNFKKWKSHNVRFFLYALVGVLVSMFVETLWVGPLTVFVLMTAELTIDHFIISKWKEYNEEQNKIMRELSAED